MSDKIEIRPGITDQEVAGPQSIAAEVVPNSALERIAKNPLDVVSAGYLAARHDIEVAELVDGITEPVQKAQAHLVLAEKEFVAGGNPDMYIRMAHGEAQLLRQAVEEEYQKNSKDMYGRAAGGATYAKGLGEVTDILLEVARFQIERGIDPNLVIQQLRTTMAGYATHTEEPVRNASGQLLKDSLNEGKSREYIHARIEEVTDNISLANILFAYPGHRHIVEGIIDRVNDLIHEDAFEAFAGGAKLPVYRDLIRLQAVIGGYGGMQQAADRVRGIKTEYGNGKVNSEAQLIKTEALALVAAVERRVSRMIPVENLTQDQINAILGSGNETAIRALGYGLNQEQVEELIRREDLPSSTIDALLAGSDEADAEMERQIQNRRRFKQQARKQVGIGQKLNISLPLNHSSEDE